MTSMDRLPESSPERIDIAQLAHELGVDEVHYTYPTGDLEKSHAIFEYFHQNVHKDIDGLISVESDVTIHLSELFSEISNIPYLPLFFGKTENIPAWEISLFFDIWVMYLICRSIELRTRLLEELRANDTLFVNTKASVERINDIELFNTFGSIFDQRVAPLLQQQPVFRDLREKILPLESWYDEQLNVARRKRAPDLFLKKANKDFWSRDDLPFTKLFISNPVTHRMDPREFVIYIDRFLCHAESEYFDLIVGGIKTERSVYLPRWKAWIHARKELLFEDNENETQKVFGKIFGIQGRIIQNGELSEQARSKLPELLSGTFDEIIAVQKKAQKKIKKTVSYIPVPVQSNTAISALLSRPAQPVKIIVPSIDIKKILPDLEASKSANKQLSQIDFSGCGFPEGTTVQVKRSLPSKKKRVFEAIEGIDPRGKNTIEPVLGQDLQGQFAYIIAVSLPLTHRFEGTNFIEVSYYAKAEPTPAEIEEEFRRQQEIKNRPQVHPVAVAVVTGNVQEEVKNIIDPVANSLIAAAFVLVEKQQLYAVQEGYQGGPINITLSDADCVEVLGGESTALLSEHKHWTVNEDNSINPIVDDTDAKEALLTIAGKIRENYRLKQEQEEKEIIEKQEIAEYESQRKNFEPLLEFARNFKFEGREKGDFEEQKDKLRTELKSFGWVLPWTLGNQVFWRHGAKKVKITYTSKMCQFFQIQTEDGRILKEAEKKCYQEVAEAFAHIARFFNIEKSERRKMITREQSMRKEVENSAVSYDALLEKGQARLVLFSPYQQSHGGWSSKFPTEINPHMLDERASQNTVEGLLEQHPHAELCYRRDQLCLNGEIGEEAGEESVENTLQNIQDLRSSPRARYILRKRILITLGLEKFGGDTARAPIVHEKNKKEHSFSALDILNHLSALWRQTKHILSPSDTAGVRDKIKQAGYGYKIFSSIQPDKLQERTLYEMQPIPLDNITQTLTADDIDDNFLDTYIDCLEFLKIRVHYVWPLSSRLDEHRARMEKHAAKVAAAEAAKATAD